MKRDVPWLPYAGFLLAVAGIVYQAGVLTGDVQRQADRITKLEASEQIRMDDIQTIDRRTTRIEAKIDLIVPSKAVTQ